MTPIPDLHLILRLFALYATSTTHDRTKDGADILFLQNPKDSKLRTLQKSNKNIAYKITNPPGCRELMSAIGWVAPADAYTLPAHVPMSTPSLLEAFDPKLESAMLTNRLLLPSQPLATLSSAKLRLEQQLEAAERVIST